jgi:hypothetical protein
MGSDVTDDQLRLDYDETTSLVRSLLDVRFKLLAFVPTISGAAVALLSRGATTAELIAVGVVGLVATLGIVLYELRNTQVYEYALERAQALEERLGFPSLFHGGETGGPFSELPGRDVRVLGLAIGHDRALALVYGAALGAWAYLVAWGVLRALDVSQPQKIGGAVGVFCGVVALVDLLRLAPRSS